MVSVPVISVNGIFSITLTAPSMVISSELVGTMLLLQLFRSDHTPTAPPTQIPFERTPKSPVDAMVFVQTSEVPAALVTDVTPGATLLLIDGVAVPAVPIVIVSTVSPADHAPEYVAVLPNSPMTSTIGSIAAWLPTAGALVAISHVSVRVSPAENNVSPSSGSFQTAVCKDGPEIQTSTDGLPEIGPVITPVQSMVPELLMVPPTLLVMVSELVMTLELSLLMVPPKSLLMVPELLMPPKFELSMVPVLLMMPWLEKVSPLLVMVPELLMVAELEMAVPVPLDNVMMPVAKLLMVAALPLLRPVPPVGDIVRMPELLMVPPLLSMVPKLVNVPVDVISMVPVAKFNRVRPLLMVSSPFIVIVFEELLSNWPLVPIISSEPL